MIFGEGGEKMSKSRGNVINPTDVIAEYGADTMRQPSRGIGLVKVALSPAARPGSFISESENYFTYLRNTCSKIGT